MKTSKLEKYIRKLTERLKSRPIWVKNRPMWVSIISTRLILIPIVLFFGFFITTSFIYQILLLISFLYILVNSLLIIIPEKSLRLRRIRFIPDIIDIGFVSIIIALERDINSVWFLFYLFPIISVARYLGRSGSLIIAGITNVAYLFLSFYLEVDLSREITSIILHCLCLLGIAFVAGNLAKDRQLSEIKHIDMLVEIDKAILADDEIKSIYEIILNKAMEITGSQRGHIRRVIGKFPTEIIVRKNTSADYEVQALALTGYYSNEVINKKKSLIISAFREKDLRNQLSGYFDPKSVPRSALFVPLLTKDKKEIMAVIAVYTRRISHYTKVDAFRLESFAPLLEIAEKQAGYLKYLHTALDKFAYPIIVIDSKGFIKGFNQGCEEIWGKTAKDSIDRSVNDFYESKEEARRLGTLLRKAPQGQIEVEAKIKDIRGDIIPITLNASLIKDGNSKIVGSFGVFRKLEIGTTEKLSKEIAEKLLDNERIEAIAKVVGFISHDVKNKLDAANMEIEMLKKYINESENERAYKSLIRLNDAITISINKIKNLAWTKSSEIHLSNPKIVFVEEIFKDHFEYLKRLADKGRTKLTLNYYPQETYRVLVDVSQIRMVLENLYDNSIYAIKESNRTKDREISIQVDSNQDQFLIYWRDNGCGISKDDLDEVFNQRFTTKKYGTGLGLYWTKSIIEKHGATIEVSSEKGEYTEFLIKLPLATESKE